MPEISRFLGIKIFMFFNEHNPPHFHAEYNEHKASILIKSFGILEGKLPSKVLGLVVEWAEDILFESDGYAADDIVTEIEGKEWTKKDVRQALLKARKAQKTFLPDQLKKVQAQIEGEQLADSFSERARKELTWLEGEDNDLRKQFEATVGDERFKQLKKVVKREAPEIAAQLDYWFAHATNSIYGRKPVTERKTSAVLNPPKSAKN